MLVELERQEDEDQQQAERVARLREHSARVSEKNASHAQTGEQLHDARKSEQAEYMKKLSSQSARVYESRQTLLAG